MYPVKLVLSDYPAALLPLQHQATDIESSLVVHDSALLEALSALFEMYWDRAIPLQVRNGRAQLPDADDAPTVHRQRSAARCWLPGSPTRPSRGSCSCNERTVRRYLKDMMHRLDAATRFQAGYQAIRRGWLATGDDQAGHEPGRATLPRRIDDGSLARGGTEPWPRSPRTNS